MKSYQVIEINPPYVIIEKDGTICSIPIEADIESWQPLSQNYSKDKKHIYFCASKVFNKHLPFLDLKTLEVIFEHPSITLTYFRDAHGVYIESFMGSFTSLEGANPVMFKIIDKDKGFSSDQFADYYFHERLPYRIADAKFLNEHYALANEKVYAGYLREVENVDLSTFEIIIPNLIENVAKDKNHIYFRDKVVEQANPKTFRFIDACIAADRPYYLDCSIDFYAKDDTYAYFVRTIARDFKVIKTKDLSNFDFKVINERGYAYDQLNVYSQGRKVKDGVD